MDLNRERSVPSVMPIILYPSRIRQVRSLRSITHSYSFTYLHIQRDQAYYDGDVDAEVREVDAIRHHATEAKYLWGGRVGGGREEIKSEKESVGGD